MACRIALLEKRLGLGRLGLREDEPLGGSPQTHEAQRTRLCGHVNTEKPALHGRRRNDVFLPI